MWSSQLLIVRLQNRSCCSVFRFLLSFAARYRISPQWQSKRFQPYHMAVNDCEQSHLTAVCGAYVCGSIMWNCVLLCGRITRLVRPSVRPSVCPMSAPDEEQKCIVKNWCQRFPSHVTIFSSNFTGQRVAGRQNLNRLTHIWYTSIRLICDNLFGSSKVADHAADSSGADCELGLTMLKPTTVHCAVSAARHVGIRQR